MSTHPREHNIPEAELRDQRTPAQPLQDHGDPDNVYPVKSTDWVNEADLQDQRTPVELDIDDDAYPPTTTPRHTTPDQPNQAGST